MGFDTIEINLVLFLSGKLACKVTESPIPDLDNADLAMKILIKGKMST